MRGSYVPRLLALVAWAAAVGLTPAGARLPAPAALRFDEVAADAGLGAFRHVGGSTPEKRYIPEVMSGGVCAFDFDDDGWVDLFFVNGGTFESLAGTAAPPPHALFRNRGDGTFEDVTGRSGIRNAGWGMGCAVADYDGDGRPDLYITYFQTPNQLWRNLGAGTFEDVTARAGAGGPAGRWNAGATFGDYDGDGHLDLFVAGYVSLDPKNLPEPEENPDCRYRGLVVNCGPRGLWGEADLLFRNNGDGTFAEASLAINGVEPEKYYGLGAVFLPLAGDGRLSLYVANDSTPNTLFHFGSDGRWTETALESGLALSEEGVEQAGMGIAWGDYDADGRTDLYVTNFADDYNTLYRNLAGGQFEDVTRRAQLAQPAWLQLGWGTAFADFDLDGHADLVVANGHVYPQIDTLKLPSRYRMPVQVFRNLRNGTFVELPRAAVPGETVGRGLAVADFWNDGRAGFAISNLDGSPALYRPRGGTGRHLGLALEGTPPNRSAVGARVEAVWPGGRATRIVASGGSYLSHSDLRVHFGAGDAGAVDLAVFWPGGRVQRFQAVATGRIYRLREGAGLSPSVTPP